MITWVTVWVLTVMSYETSSNYQLTYKTEADCKAQIVKHQLDAGFRSSDRVARCDSHQVPMVGK